MRVSCRKGCEQMCGSWDIAEPHSRSRHFAIVGTQPMNKNTQDPKLQMSTWTHLSAASMMYIAHTV